MKNETVRAHFDIVSDFRAGRYLNPPDGAVPEALLDQTPLRYLDMRATHSGTRAIILQAVPADRWVSSFTVAERSGIAREIVSSELFKLTTQQKVIRRRDDGRYLYQRNEGA